MKMEIITRREKNGLNVNEFTLEFINICKKHLLYENVTLLYAAHSEKENNAIILREWIQNRMLLL